MKILDIALKDLLRSFRSLFAVGMMLVAPLLITGLIYIAFSGMGGDEPAMPSVHVGLVNLDAPPADAPIALGAAIVEMFSDESVAEWLTTTAYPDADAARAALDRQEIGAAVVIPANLSAAILSGERNPDATVRILRDPTLTLGPQVVYNMVAGVLDGVTGGGIAIRVVQERHAARGQAFDPAQIPALIQDYQTWYVEFQRALFHHPETAALRLVAPAATAEPAAPMSQMMALIMVGQMIFFAFYTAAYSMTSILTEQEEGSLARLFTTPTRRTAILAGKFAAVFFTTVIQGVILMLFGSVVFGIQWGRPASVALALTAQVTAAAGLGVLLISLVKNTRQSGPVLGGGLTTFGMLGGLFTVGVQNMPAVFATLSLFTPHGWVLQSWKLALAGQPASALLLPCAIAIGIGAVMFAAGATLFRRRFA